jgi:methyl-accepting chemotaxis protein
MSLNPTRLSQWSLRVRLIAFAVGASAVVALIGALGLLSAAKVSGSNQRIYEDRTQSLVKLDVVGRTLERQRANILSTIAAPTDESIQALSAGVTADNVGIGTMMTQYLRGASDADEQVLAAKFSQGLDRLQKDGLVKVVDFLKKGQTIEADVASQSLYQPQSQAVGRALDDLIKVQVTLAEREYLDSQKLVRALAITTLVVTVLALLTGITFSILIARTLHRTLGTDEGQLKEMAQAVSDGNLNGKIAVHGGLATSVAGSLNAMIDRFSELVSGVTSSAKWLASAAERQAKASHELSARTSSQAATLEETAASMEELSTTVKQNSKNAQRARELALGGLTIATQGRKDIVEVTATMDGITQYSRKIKEIVSVIDGIAFQTNLLALNAAVEAARAGESGRGFAVVATEVRSLSQRSAMAASEIKALIEESTTRVEAGNQLVAKADRTMGEIVSANQRVSEIISEIATASSEQLIGIEQVNSAVTQMEGVTQQNAILAERAAMDAQNMTGQAGLLVEAVSRFAVDDCPKEMPIPELASRPFVPTSRQSRLTIVAD